MSSTTNIEWCDATFNPWIGCTKVSPGCAHCYAETLDRNRYSKTLGGGTREAPISHWGPGAPRHRTGTWGEPLRWNLAAQAAGKRPRVFCASLADWLDAEVPLDWLCELLLLIRACSHLDWLLLTKRPQLWASRMEAVRAAGGISGQIAAEWLCGRPMGWVWVGTTIEDRPRMTERLSPLLAIPAAVRFLSCEPLLEHIRLDAALLNLSGDDTTPGEMPGIHWVICGGESGPGARPMHPEWARSLREQCYAASVPFFFKQWGDWLPMYQEMARTTPAIARDRHHWDDGTNTFRVGKIVAGRQLDGAEHSKFPRSPLCV